MQKKKRVLIAPLDWGLGHATRCVPLIRQKAGEGYEVVLAACGSSADFLSQAFPDLPLHRDIPSYRIHYSGNSLMWSMVSQLPKIFSAVKKEKRWLEGFVERYHPDEVISDNRYGLYTKRVYCTFITHQLFPMVPWWVRYGVHRLICHYIRQFDQCLIPDWEDAEMSLSGNLSHGNIPTNCKFIGPQSRFSTVEKVVKRDGAEEAYRIVALISGPEPQRELLEKKLSELLFQTGIRSLIICGQPGITRNEKIKNIAFVHHLDDASLAGVIRQSELLICRSGYSTIMDIECLEKKALLIPTPGQTEQEYLARYLTSKGYSMITQENLSSEILLMMAQPLFCDGMENKGKGLHS
ncbi:MAG: glycosyltransferase [Crocinitomicaceae bacterium]|nr:glycosyltransferase [Crocinitomicaceae bacterium]